MMNVDELLNTDVINLRLKANTKEEAIKELTDLLAEKGAISSKEEFLSDVFEREAQGPTGIGNSIAIPHGKSDYVERTAMAIGRSETDLEWESLDDQPVRVVILFAVRSADQNGLHLKLLASVARSLANEDICNQLLHSNDPTEIITALQNG
jgi:PTS system fructose-specific IIA component